MKRKTNGPGLAEPIRWDVVATSKKGAVTWFLYNRQSAEEWADEIRARMRYEKVEVREGV